MIISLLITENKKIPLFDGISEFLRAQGGTRTRTPLLGHDPESCASTNFATWALLFQQGKFNKNQINFLCIFEKNTEFSIQNIACFGLQMITWLAWYTILHRCGGF